MQDAILNLFHARMEHKQVEVHNGPQPVEHSVKQDYSGRPCDFFYEVPITLSIIPYSNASCALM